MLKKFLEPLTRNEPVISSLFVTGNVGVGKTALTKFVLLNIPAKINYAYVPVKEGCLSSATYAHKASFGGYHPLQLMAPPAASTLSTAKS